LATGSGKLNRAVVFLFGDCDASRESFLRELLNNSNALQEVKSAAVTNLRSKSVKELWTVVPRPAAFCLYKSEIRFRENLASESAKLPSEELVKSFMSRYAEVPFSSAMIFELWNCGQENNYFRQIFFIPTALYIMVVDLNSNDLETKASQVSHWMQSVLSHAPSATIRVFTIHAVEEKINSLITKLKMEMKKVQYASVFVIINNRVFD